MIIRKNILEAIILCLILFVSGIGFAWSECGCTPSGCSGWTFNYSQYLHDETAACGQCIAQTGGTCGSLKFGWDSCCDCSVKSSDAPDHLDADAQIEWDSQGPNVIAVTSSDCQGTIAAKGTIRIVGQTSACVEETKTDTHVACNEVTIDMGERTVHIKKSVTFYYSAVFDSTVFKVNGQQSPACLGSGTSSVTVDLVNTKCETLQKALNSTVTIYKQKYQKMYSPTSCNLRCVPCLLWPCLDSDPPPYVEAELKAPEQLATVGVTFEGDPFSCECPAPGTPTDCPSNAGNSGGGNTNCGSCSGGTGNGNLKAGHITVKPGVDTASVLPVFASPGVTRDSETGEITEITNTPEINAGGSWVRAEYYPYEIQGDPTTFYTFEGNPITKVSYSFSVEVRGQDTYYYGCELTGSWADEDLAREAFLEEFRGNIPLQYVENKSGDRILGFEYDPVTGDLAQQLSYEAYVSDTNYTTNGIAIYEYDDSSLSRVWVGTDAADYSSDSNAITGGRWVDLIYSPAGSDGKSYLERIEYGGCSTCRSPLIYERGGSTGDLLTTIKRTDGTVLAAYDYDSQGRYKRYVRGSHDEEILVNTWDHSDYDLANPEITSGDNMLLRKDFVDNTHYRASVFFADDNGSLTKEIRYHDVQDDEEGLLKGSYSVYRYYWEENETLGWKRYVVQYPKGNKLFKYYDDNDNLIKVQWDGIAHAESEYVYGNPITYGGQTRYVVRQKTNASGGVTGYTYCDNAGENWFNIETRTDPASGAGISGSDQQVTTYVYDNQNRVDYEFKRDSKWTSSNPSYVYTKYVYDSEGRLIRLHENCIDYTSSDPQTGLITEYEYNDYNELVKTTYPSGAVHCQFYSDAGTLIADAVYDHYAIRSAVSATVYIYDDGMLEVKKTAKMNTSFTFTETEVAAGGGTGITWIQEFYDYDVYGREIAVVSDYGGQNLRTEYEYNNQDEIVRVLKPDGRYTKTIRDGRGLVSQEITGVEINEVEKDKATTTYFYDLNGNLIKKIDPEGVTEIYVYDSKDRMIRSRRGR